MRAVKLTHGNIHVNSSMNYNSKCVFSIISQIFISKESRLVLFYITVALGYFTTLAAFIIDLGHLS